MKGPLADPEWRASAHPTALSEEELLAQCELGRGRSSGPGGQHRNRVRTLVVLTHAPTGISAQAGERRSAEENKAVALRRLRYALAVEHRTGVPEGEARTALWARRCTREGRIVCSERHRDHPTLIAEALDVIAARHWDLDRAATRLVCTRSQLIKLLGSYPQALAKLNEERESRGMHPLRA